MAAKIITAERLRELLHYDPETGIFTARFNSGKRRAGKPVGTLEKRSGYYVMRLDGATYLSHRMAWLYMTGELPQFHIDHINMCKGDNRFANLRDVGAAVNTQNIGRARKSNESGFLGVSLHKKSGAWHARIQVAGKQRYIGSYPTPEEAHGAYLKAKRELHEGCTI